MWIVFAGEDYWLHVYVSVSFKTAGVRAIIQPYTTGRVKGGSKRSLVIHNPTTTVPRLQDSFYLFICSPLILAPNGLLGSSNTFF